MAALRYDPLRLLTGDVPAPLAYHVRSGLLGEDCGPVESLWATAAALAVVRGQRPDGSFAYPGGRAGANAVNYDLLETFRQLRVLVAVFGMDVRCGAFRAAADYVLSCQSPAGDIRGILGNQLMPYYHAAILELLIRGGMGDDARVARGLQWLLDTRQDDGGWVVPAQTVAAKEKTDAFWSGEPVTARRTAPSSSLATGMVLPALAAHPSLRRSAAAGDAARLLGERILKPDRYGDRKGAGYWTKFQYPFWWPNLLTLATALREMGYPAAHPTVAALLEWFVANQAPDGLWPTGYECGKRAEIDRRWVGYAVMRALRPWLGSTAAC